MNRTSTVLAALAMAAAGPALAQSSMALFGIVDVAARVVHNDRTQFRLESGGMSTSRLGVRALEDLGGGLRAGFWIEGQLNADDGNAGGLNWRRRSTLSLISRTYGEVRLGRDRVPTHLNWTAFDPFDDTDGTGLGAATKLAQLAGIVPAGGAFNGFSRLSNMVAYLTPASTGFFGQFAVAAGEGALGNKYVGARAGYAAGPVLVSASWGRTESTATIDANTFNFGASYDLQFFKLHGMYSYLDIGPKAQANYFIGVSAPVQGFVVRATWQKMDGRQGVAASNATLLALGGDYKLSRRTALYFTFAAINNNRNTRFTVADAAPLSLGNSSTGLDLGIRHAF